MEVQIGELVGLEEPIRNERVKQAQAENVELCSSVPASELEEGRRGGGGAVAIKSLDDWSISREGSEGVDIGQVVLHCHKVPLADGKLKVISSREDGSSELLEQE